MDLGNSIAKINASIENVNVMGTLIVMMGVTRNTVHLQNVSF